jgi:hypothetical protein
MTGPRIFWRLSLLLLAALVGACAGGVYAPHAWVLRSPLRPAGTLKAHPYPHHIPKYPGGVSLRFAMVHDVLHERFPRHGTAYYQERNSLVRRALEEGKDLPRDKRFALLDDLGVGLEFVGEHEEAIRVLRDKLREQQALGMQGRDLYSSYANLGTFLILGPFRQVRPGNADDKQTLYEGLDFIHKSIEVNPEAHFGREAWQAVIVEFMIALLDDPQLLLKYDMIGDRLDKAIDPAQQRCYRGWGGFDLFQAEHYLKREQTAQGNPRWREAITQIGAEEGWTEAVKSQHQKPVPFDEPALGIVGMWRLGGGAHPHFALALGEIMVRVGQRYIAWCAYERAARLAGLAWPDKELQQKFVEHCRRRQAVIEQQLPANDRERLRPAFETELDLGQRYQQGYQRYEEQRIAAGASIDDPHFYDAFHAEHDAIATPVGSEDQFVVEEAPRGFFDGTEPLMLLFAGLFAFATAFVLRIWAPR